MSSHLPDTIELYESIPGLIDEAFIAGLNYLDDQGRMEIRLTIKDDAGEREILRHEGDTFEFAGGTWRIKIFEGNAGPRSPVATLSRVE
jgi:hypothetical protein